jgi:hypothetical protein
MKWMWPALVAVCLIAAGCGAGGNPREVGAKNIPLPSGTKIVAHARTCDRGTDPYCSIQMVIVGPRYGSSIQLLYSEKDLLKQRGWTSQQGPDGPERSADSPGHELRITYATAFEDLLGVDSNWIQRAPPIGHALSKVIFDRSPAISLMLVRGSS